MKLKLNNYWETVCRTVRPMLWDRCLSCLYVCPVCNVDVLWSKRFDSDITLDGDPAPPLRKGQSTPIFSACLLWPNGWTDQDATWYEDRPRPTLCKMGIDPAPPPQKSWYSPQLSAHVCCGHRAGWIKMPHCI